MTVTIGRRELLAALGGAAAAWPLAARAQQLAKVARIGFLFTGSLESPEGRLSVDTLRQGLNQHGYVEGQNLVIEYRAADGRFDRLAGLASELAQLKVDLIVATATPAGRAAQQATSTIPIVVTAMGDPVQDGLVASLAHPGGNITGVAMLQTPVVAKRLDLLHQLIPPAVTIALLTNPANPFGQAERREVETAARTLGLELHIANAKHQDEIDALFPSLIAQGARAIVIGADAYYFNQRSQIAALAARYAIPAIAQWREYPAAGGLMSYGSNIPDAYRLTGIYVGRILKGEKPADMPVQQPTKFELVINLKAAKALGLSIPPTLLATADEVIE